MRICGVSFSVLVSVCWEWWFPGSSMSLQRTRTRRFWWLHNIPWCIRATFSLSSQSIIDGHLGWFQVFAIVNCAAMNIRVHMSFAHEFRFIISRTIYNPLDIYPVMGLLGQMGFLFLRPWGITTPSSIVVVLIYILTNSMWEFSFLHILASIYYRLLFRYKSC